MTALSEKDLCAAFCGELEVRNVPAGLAVRTPFVDREGDSVGFYIVDDGTGTRFRIEDSGLAVPKLEAAGVSLSSETRGELFQSLLNEYDAHVDQETMELHSEFMLPALVPAAALRFSALLLRIQDLDFLRAETIGSTFADDVRDAVLRRLSGLATVSFPSIEENDVGDYQPDIRVSSESGVSASIYFGTRNERVDEAVMAWLEARLHKRNNERFAVMYEQEKHGGVSSKSYRRALNRLDANMIYRADEAGAIDRIVRLAGLDEIPSIH